MKLKLPRRKVKAKVKVLEYDHAPDGYTIAIGKFGYNQWQGMVFPPGVKPEPLDRMAAITSSSDVGFSSYRSIAPFLYEYSKEAVLQRCYEAAWAHYDKEMRHGRPGLG